MSGDGIDFEAFGAGGPVQAIEPSSPNRTLRDEFAMSIIQGHMANENALFDKIHQDPDGYAGVVYRIADAMLKARRGDA